MVSEWNKLCAGGQDKLIKTRTERIGQDKLIKTRTERIGQDKLIKTRTERIGGSSLFVEVEWFDEEEGIEHGPKIKSFGSVVPEEHALKQTESLILCEPKTFREASLKLYQLS